MLGRCLEAAGPAGSLQLVWCWGRAGEDWMGNEGETDNGPKTRPREQPLGPAKKSDPPMALVVSANS